MFYPHNHSEFFMHPNQFLSMVFALLVMLGIFSLVLLSIFFLVKGWHKRKSEISSQEELEAVQELHQLAIRLEKRIDSLETILYETKAGSRQHKNE